MVDRNRNSQSARQVDERSQAKKKEVFSRKRLLGVFACLLFFGAGAFVWIPTQFGKGSREIFSSRGWDWLLNGNSVSVPKRDFLSGKTQEKDQHSFLERSLSERQASTAHRGVQTRSAVKKESDPQSWKRNWSQFQKKFGKHLRADFSSQGQLLRIRGEVGQGKPNRSGEFTSQNSIDVIHRSEQVVQAVKALIHYEEQFPIQQVQAQPGKWSAQVHYRQVWSDLPLEPLGKLKVDLGPQGELLGVDSDYHPGVQVKNGGVFEVSEIQARSVAQAHLKEDGTHFVASLKEGRKIIWVDRRLVGFPAYSYSEQGRTVVISAQGTPKLLSFQDKRRHKNLWN